MNSVDDAEVWNEEGPNIRQKNGLNMKQPKQLLASPVAAENAAAFSTPMIVQMLVCLQCMMLRK